MFKTFVSLLSGNVSYVSIPVRGSDLSLLENVQTESGPNQIIIQSYYGFPLQE